MLYAIYGRVELQHVMSEIEDLDAAIKAATREKVIREVMADSGEDRGTVTNMINAMDSLGQEAVLHLTEGEPTTLADALSRLAQAWHQDGVPDGAEYDLDKLLAYPWPKSDPVDAEAFWRSRLAREVYQHADRIEHESETRSLGVALASIFRHVGDEIGKMSS